MLRGTKHLNIRSLYSVLKIVQKIERIPIPTTDDDEFQKYKSKKNRKMPRKNSSRQSSQLVVAVLHVLHIAQCQILRKIGSDRMVREKPHHFIKPEHAHHHRTDQNQKEVQYERISSSPKSNSHQSASVECHSRPSLP